MYRVYSGPAGAVFGPLDKSSHLFKSFDSLDEALSWAHHIKDTGRTALLIEGDDGTRIDKQQLAKALHHRQRACPRRSLTVYPSNCPPCRDGAADISAGFATFDCPFQLDHFLTGESHGISRISQRPHRRRRSRPQRLARAAFTREGMTVSLAARDPPISRRCARKPAPPPSPATRQ